MDATARLDPLRGMTTYALVPAITATDPSTDGDRLPVPVTPWDVKAAVRRMVAEQSADRLSARLGVDVKALRKLSSVKPRRLTTGAAQALRRGTVVVDELGIMRCPPGTPNAMEFTNHLGSNCMGGAATKPMRVAIGDVRERVGGSSVVSAVDIAVERLGERLKGRRSRRDRLVEGTRNLIGRGVENDGPNSWQRALAAMRNPKEGFTFDIALGEGVTSGFAIARPDRGIKIKATDLFDEDGNIRDEGALQLAKMIAVNGEELTTPSTVTVDGRTHTAERVALGGWHNDEDGYVYFDVTDVFPEDIGAADAWQIGKDRNQWSVANLRVLSEEKAARQKLLDDGTPEADLPELSGTDIDGVMNGIEAAFIASGGDGGDLLPDDAFDEMLPNAVSLNAHGDAMEQVLKAIAGTDTLDLENFTPEKVEAMLTYLQRAPGFGWIDPQNPDHLSLVLLQMSDNLMWLMDRASPEERSLWSRWYDVARSFNLRVADETGIEPRTMAAITARLSPQKDWDQNTAMAEHAAKLLSDKEYVIDEAVAVLAYKYALEQWKARKGTGRGSHKLRIKNAQKLVDEAKSKLAGYEAQKPGKKRDNGITQWTSNLAVRERALTDALEAQRVDTMPSVEDFLGKTVPELSDEHAAATIRAHGELEGGAYIGQPLAELSKQAVAAGVSPRGLVAYRTELLPDGEPGDHVLVGNPKSRVRAQSMDTYRSVVRIYRSEGDMEVIDYELGDGPKVRSFFNNNLNPMDELHRDVTIDTHAVAGELLIPVAAAHDLTNLAFGSVTSLGTAQAYPLMRAAMIATMMRWEAATGEKYLPRQIQSITWEAMRALVPAKSKRYIADRIAQIQRLGNGPDADPRFAGDAGKMAILRLIEAATVDLTELNKELGLKGKKMKTRNGLLEEAFSELGLPALTAADRLKKSTKNAAAKQDAG